MFKRLTAILITLAMLFGMCAVVSADTPDPYEYLPRDVTIVCYSGNNGAVVAWKNPTSTLLTKVTVTDTGNNEELGTVENPTPGVISRVESQTASSEYGLFKVKLTFEFSNGQIREVFHTEDKRNRNLYTGYTTSNVGISGLNDYNVFTSNNENATTDGSQSLKVVSNITQVIGDTAGKIFFNSKASNSFPAAGSLKSSTYYNFKYKVKTSSELVLNHTVNGNGNMLNNTGTVTIQPSNDWQTVEGSFLTKENSGTNAYAFFGIVFSKAADAPFYIDDVELIELTGENGSEYTGEDTTTYKWDFEYSVRQTARPTNVTASSLDGAAAIGWRADSDARFINIYEIVDGKKILRDRMNAQKDTSVDIDGLTNGKTYRFAVSASAFEGYESEAQEIEVTPAKQVISKYEYEPSNVMITGYRDQTYQGGYAVSWINPTSDKLSSVKLYEINGDGTETEKKPNRIFMPKIYGNKDALLNALIKDVNTPGAVVRFENQPAGAESGTATYRLIFEFSDGQKRDIVYTGNWDYYNYQIIDETGKVIESYSGYDMSWNGSDDNTYNIDALAAVSSAKISHKQVKDGSSVSLELSSNQTRDGCGRMININLSSKLTPNAKYNFKMDVNTVGKGALSLGDTYAGDPGGNEIPNTNGEWQTVSGTFTASMDRMHIRPGMAMRETYIDNIRVWKVGEDESTAATYSFSDIADSAPEAVSGVSATQGEKNSTTISWTAGGGQYVNVYEDIDENTTDDVHTWMFRARVPKAQTSVTLNNLETDKTHNFMVVTEKSGAQYNGLESAGVTCSATLVMPDYEINDVKLLANDEEVENFIPGGTYTAKANVTNAKIDDGLKTQVIVAVYANGVLENCVVSDAKTIVKGASETITVPSFTIGNEDKTYTAKIMVWKGLESVTPLLKNSVTYTTAE